jgi:hypothetical protein
MNVEVGAPHAFAKQMARPFIVVPRRAKRNDRDKWLTAIASVSSDLTCDRRTLERDRVRG